VVHEAAGVLDMCNQVRHYGRGDAPAHKVTKATNRIHFLAFFIF
jgi:hypothetical protein